MPISNPPISPTTRAACNDAISRLYVAYSLLRDARESLSADAVWDEYESSRESISAALLFVERAIGAANRLKDVDPV